MPADTVVRARIDTATKERASAALEAMGLSISDAIRLLMLRIAEEQRLPFEVKVPNATTRRAMAELNELDLQDSQVLRHFSGDGAVVTHRPTRPQRRRSFLPQPAR
jgi:DNA-damage-inducible protein J